MSESRTWTLAYRSRPLTANRANRANRYARAAAVALWREAFWGLALEAKVARCQRVRITARAHLRGLRSIDTDACAPSVKAAIDGLVDARVIPDDGPGHVEAVLLLPPVLGAERDEFTITIEEGPPVV